MTTTADGELGGGFVSISFYFDNFFSNKYFVIIYVKHVPTKPYLLSGSHFFLFSDGARGHYTAGFYLYI